MDNINSNSNSNFPDNGLVNLAARAAWEASRAWCFGMGDASHKAYDDLSTEEKAPVRESVIGILQGNTPEQIHQAWLRRKVSEGWSYGVEKDEERRLHPACLPYNELSPEQRVKNDIWRDVTQMMQKLYWTYPQ